MGTLARNGLTLCLYHIETWQYLDDVRQNDPCVK